MNLSKALDELPHSLLIAKLKAYGMSTVSVIFLKRFLSERWQQEKIGYFHRTWQRKTKGVPQGSILGLVIFNLFVNAMYMCVKDCERYNYADDNTMCVKYKDKANKVRHFQSKTTEYVLWFRVNYIQANPSKFQAIH